MSPEPPTKRTQAENLRRILQNPAYLRAYEDVALLHREELRPVRLQLELLKVEEIPDQPDLRRSPDALVEEELLTKSRQNYYLTELGADRVRSAREDGEIE